MSTPLDPLLRPDHCVALMLGEAIADDCETYSVVEVTSVPAPGLPSNRSRLTIEIAGKTLDVIVYERPELDVLPSPRDSDAPELVIDETEIPY